MSKPGFQFKSPIKPPPNNVQLVPIKEFPRRPTTSDTNYPTGQTVILGPSPSTGSEGELWYLANFSSGNAQWFQISTGGEDVESMPTDSGTATPNSSGALTLAGGTNINTAGSSSTATVNLDDAITLSTVNATTFDTNVAAAGVTLSGTTLAADGTDSNIDITLTPKGTGSVLTDNLSFNGNTIASTDTNGDLNLTPDGTGVVYANNQLSAGDGASPPASPLVYAHGNTASQIQIFLDNAGAGIVKYLGRSTGGDCTFAMITDGGGAADYELGLDQADSNTFKEFNAGGFDAGSVVRAMTQGGVQTLPLQPAFLAKADGTQTNLPLNTLTVVQFAEVYDRANNYASNTFTAPRTGIYQMSFMVLLIDMDIDTTTVNLAFRVNLVGGGTDNYVYKVSPSKLLSADGNMSFSSSLPISLSAGDTVDVYAQLSPDGANQMDIGANSYFGGVLLC